MSQKPLTAFPAISSSDIENYEGCPKRWHLKRILRDERFKFHVTEAITHGNLTHERLERYVKYDEVLPDHVLYLVPFFAYLREQGYTLYAELEVAITKDWQPTSFWAKDCYLRGKVDLIALKDTTAIVVDYKTGKEKNARYKDDTQLQIYSAVLMSVLGLTEVSSYFFWTATQGSDKHSLTTETFEDVKADITRRIDRMKDAYDNEQFPARTSPLCGWCPALDTCEEASYYKEKRDRERR